MAIKQRTNWVLDADIKSFFDQVDHDWMKQFIEHRIGDKRLVRLLMRWLKAGVMEDGKVHGVQTDTPQGGVISPLLANIYLHYVFDTWVHQWRTHKAHGNVYVVRYADDFVVCFKNRRDADAMQEALSERLARFGLELSEEKTKLLAFGRYARDRLEGPGRKKPDTFDFLGFTHISTQQKYGFDLVRRTSRKKRQAKLAEIREQLRKRRHEPVRETHKWLSAVLRGHYAYYGVPTNKRGLRSFRANIRHAWYRQLSRRSQKSMLTVADKQRLEKRFLLPRPRIHHPHPEKRFTSR